MFGVGHGVVRNGSLTTLGFERVSLLWLFLAKETTVPSIVIVCLLALFIAESLCDGWLGRIPSVLARLLALPLIHD